MTLESCHRRASAVAEPSRPNPISTGHTKNLTGNHNPSGTRPLITTKRSPMRLLNMVKSPRSRIKDLNSPPCPHKQQSRTANPIVAISTRKKELRISLRKKRHLLVWWVVLALLYVFQALVKNHTKKKSTKPIRPQKLTTKPKGSHILTILKSHQTISTIYAFSRRELPPHQKVTTISACTPTDWPTRFPKDVSVFVSALGTTARIAGSFAAQRRIDYDLNLSMAKAAKAAGVLTYILISTSGASPTSRIPYSRMKGELDEAVKEIGFEHMIILESGLLVGARENSRPGESMGRSVASFLGRISGNALKILGLRMLILLRELL